MIQRLIFYCPSQDIGGTEVLFSRLALRIASSNLSSKLQVLDIEGGVLSQLCGTHAQVEVITQLDQTVDQTLIFTPAKCLHQLYEVLKDKNLNSKILVWQLGNGGLSETLFLPFWLKFKISKTLYNYVRSLLSVFFYTSFQKAKSIVSNLKNKKALVFTDFIGALETFNDLQLKELGSEEIKILPIFVDSERNEYLERPTCNKNELNIGWLGRTSSDFKIHSLSFSINSIIEQFHQQFDTLNFHIIGNGDAFPVLETLKAEKEKQFPNVKFNLYGALNNKDSINLLLLTSDIVVGMGTASLDVAKFGIPSLIVNPVTNQSQNHLIKFRWLFDSKGFSLGEFPNNVTISGQIGYSNISVLINEFLFDKKKISQKTHVFVENFFSSSVAFDKFLEMVALCNYTSADFVKGFTPIYKSRQFFKNFTKFYQPKWLPKYAKPNQ